ncbi:pseudouridine synthase [Aquabacterium sp.]|uniref:pseudouridine synthase n=1 Tax=Aquabacterium sp. TaxID=1872578 RepID=UPI0035B1411B
MSDRPRSPRQPASSRSGFGGHSSSDHRSGHRAPGRPGAPGAPASRAGGPAAPHQRPPARPQAAPTALDPNEPLRLSKRMAELGLASRREADELIAKGWVKVDGVVVSELGSKVTRSQRVEISQQAQAQQARRVTVLINKPMGYVSGQAEDGYEPAVVLVTPDNHWRDDRSGVRFERSHLRSLVPAGRLDIDSVGLLVLTQDGVVARQLIGDDSEVEKEYLVRVAWPDAKRAGPLPEIFPANLMALLNHGLSLDGVQLRPARVSWQNDDQLRFVLREGRKRQIRRMCEAVGLKVVGLKRVRIGRVMLGDLPPGQWRYLRADESFV